MKFLLRYLLLCTVIAFTACKKGDEIAGDGTLQGKWKMTGNYLSSGGPQYFVAAKDVKYANFNSDGTIGGTALADFTNYAITDSITLSFTHTDKTIFTYYYKITGNKLSISPRTPYMCIEGCSLEFVKIK